MSMTDQELQIELDDVKAVMFVLRHKCDGVRKATEAIRRVALHTKLPEERVEQLLKKYFKDGYV